jgi:serine/threonine protein kinase
VQGFSAWTVSGSRFEVQAHYRLLRAVGTGAYGVVVSAEDTRTGARVAIKKVPNGPWVWCTSGRLCSSWGARVLRVRRGAAPRSARQHTCGQQSPPLRLQLYHHPPARCRAAFHDLTDALRILREIRLMRHFNHENVVAIVDLGPPESLATLVDVYIFSE